MNLNRWIGRLAALAVGLAAAVAMAQAPVRELLNSERIEARFGSYGIEVLASDADVRVSNLFSADAAGKICRTFAVVGYPAAVAPQLAAEHAAIVAGGSIGAVFSAHGWQVRKSHLDYGELPASARLATLMHVAIGSPLAEDVYVLDVVKDGRTFQYAALVEIHHPDYLTRADLQRIYGPADPGDRGPLVAEMLTLALERSSR